MKTKLNKLLFLLPVLMLSSCGYALENIFKGDRFYSAVFANNYYDIWDNELTKFKGKDGTLLESEKVFTNYSSFIKTGLDEQAAVWNYFWLPKYQEGANNYSYYRKMTAADQTFNYGYLSKLYDGQMFCGGDYQLSRVQINETGYGQYFSKQGKNPGYFAMNFKASADFTNTSLLSKIYEEDPTVFPNYPSYSHKSSIDITVSLYVVDNQNLIKYDYKNTITDIWTNKEESMSGLEYTFFGFSLANLPAGSHVAGYSINYVCNDPAVNTAKEKLGETLDYSLMVYEVMFPFASWN